MRRPISSRLHGILDYATAAQLLTVPTLLRTGGSRSGVALRVAGAAYLATAATTRYELGLVKLLPLRAHLVLDVVGSVGLAASPWLLGTRVYGPRHWLPHVLFAASDVAVAALTDPDGIGATGAPAAPGAAQPTAPPAATTPQVADEVVLPEGVEANEGIGARTIGTEGGRGQRSQGGIGSGTGPGSDPGVGGEQV